MNVTLQIIELKCIHFGLTEYGSKQKKFIDFNGYEFDFNLEIKVNEDIKGVAAGFKVSLSEKVDAHKKYILAEMESWNAFTIVNFDEVIRKEESKILLPDNLILVVTSLTINHARAMLSMKLESTNYNNAIIPLMDPKIFLPGN